MTFNSGVYALIHLASQKIYIGSSVDLAARRSRWWDNLNKNPQNLPPLIRDLTSSRHDWEFRPLLDGTGLSAIELEEMEQRTVIQIRELAPDRLLNELPVARPDTAGLTINITHSLNEWSRRTGIPRATIAARLQRGWTPEQAVGLAPSPERDRSAEGAVAAEAASVLVVDDAVDPPTLLNRRQTAERLGCQPRTLAERLRKYRAPDGSQIRVNLSHLKNLSDKYRR